MGNAASSGDAVPSDDEEPLMEEAKSDPGSGDAGMDLALLFDLEKVREMSFQIGEPFISDLLRIHKKDFQQWLEDRHNKGEDLLNFSQFMEFWAGKGCSREECLPVFMQFDLHGEGVVDIDQIRLYLSSYASDSANSTLSRMVKDIENSGMFPCLVDAFVLNKPTTPDHHRLLLDFVLRNRVSSNMLQVPALDSFHRQVNMRMKVLNKHLEAARKKAEGQKGTVSTEEHHPLRQITTRCFSSLETSSNQADAHRLINGRTGDYWQSEGRTGTHWIRLHMKPGMVVKQLQINVSATDHSYVPSLVQVQAGSRTTSLRQVSEARIPNRFGGYLTLLENCKKEYPVIQINIKRCHSDGCDTRVRAVVVKGYKPERAREGSLLDSSALWFLQLVRSTAAASIPTTPQLRSVILAQSRSAVTGMFPLSLAIGSSHRPTALSSVVLDEVTDFLDSLLCDPSGALSPDGLHSLLGLTVARGKVVTILKVSQLLFGNQDIQLNVCRLLHQMVDTVDTCKRSHGERLSLELVACDGGHKDEDSKPVNVIYPGPDAFFSADGKNKCHLVFKCRHSSCTEITQLVLKVSRGAIGAKSGLVFVFDYTGEFSLEAVVPRLVQYNEWTSREYVDYVYREKEESTNEQFAPVGYFEMTSETDEVETDMDFIRPGQFILLKLLGPRLETAERIGVVSVVLKGYRDVRVPVEDKQLSVEQLAPLPELSDSGSLLSGSCVALHLLAFACGMADDLERLREQKRFGGGLTSREPRLEVYGMTLQSIWSTYRYLLDRNTAFDETSRLLLLRLLLYLLPFLSASSSKERQEMKRDPETHRQLTCEVFKHLCEIVDDSSRYLPSVQWAAKEVILEGASVFFPDDETRRFHLMQMIDSIVASKRVPSQDLTFESMCRFFSGMDANSLLGLPSQASEGEPVGSQAIATLSTLTSVTQVEAISCLSLEQLKLRKPSDLVQLLCALQRSLCSWCYTQLVQSPTDGQKQSVAGVIAQYTEMMSEKVQELLARLKVMDIDMTLSIERLGHSFMGTAFRQLVVTLGHKVFLSLDPCRVAVLRSLLPVCVGIENLSRKGNASPLFPPIVSNHWATTSESVILKTWDRESRHKYDNNSKIYETFECPGAKGFKVEFDPQCETEKRYDYLEFIDSAGQISRYDQKVGTDKWPLTVMFKSGGKLQFHFRSDSSTNEWGYKFKVFALGYPETLLCWMYDLQLHLAMLCGQFTSYGLIAQSVDPKPGSSPFSEDPDGKSAQRVVWKTLFSGGYQGGFNPSESVVNKFLKSLPTAREGTAVHLIEHLQRIRRGFYGGDELVNSTVHSVFAALLWHSPDLHPWIQQLASPAKGQSRPSDIPPGVLQAFSMAESLRGGLVERRQRMIQKLNDQTDSGPPASKKQKVEYRETEIDPTAHIVACRDKALFLLSVDCSSSGKKSQQQIEKVHDHMPKWLIKPKNWSRLSFIIGSDAHYKQVHSNVAQSVSQSSATSAILEFIRNDAFSLENVKRVLVERTQRAAMVSDVYRFAADFIRACGHEGYSYTLAVTTFSVHMFDYQKQFPRHYLDGLDGCGLDLEHRVQQAYYNLIKVMMDVLQEGQKQTTSHTSDLVSFRTSVLHLLHVEWRVSDLQFMVDTDFVELLAFTFRAADPSPRARDMGGEDNEEAWIATVYKEQEVLLSQAKEKENFSEWFAQAKQKPTTEEEHGKLNLFVAVYCDVIGETMTCTSCQRQLIGLRYRCRYCLDTNLCEDCYKGKIFPECHCPAHEVFRFEFKCTTCGGFVYGYCHFYKGSESSFHRCHGCYLKRSQSGSSSSPPSGFTGHTIVQRGEYDIDYVARSERGSTGALLQNYGQTSAWVTFVQVALMVNDLLKSPEGVEPTVLKLANKIYLNCINRCFDSIFASCQREEEEEEQQEKMRDFMMGRLRGGRMGARMREMLPFRRMPAAFFMRHLEEEFMGLPHELLMEHLMFRDFGGMDGPPGEDEDGEKGEDEPEEQENTDIIKDRKYGQQDKAHYHGRLENYVGLLAIALPPDGTLSRWLPLRENFDEFVATLLIPATFKIIGRADYAETESRVACTAFLGQFLARVQPEVADQAVALGAKVKPAGRLWRDEPVEPEVPREYKLPGERAVDFFVKFGGRLMERQNHDTGSAVAQAVRHLSLIPCWQQAVTSVVLGRLSELMETVENSVPDLAAIFNLHVLAGFPATNGMGGLAHVYDGGELKTVGLMRQLRDRPTICTLDIDTRKRRNRLKSTVRYYPDEDSKANIVNTVEDFQTVLFALIKLVDVFQAQAVMSSQELVWSFGLLLKAVVSCIEGDDNLQNRLALLTCGCLPRFFHLACKGTNVTRELMLEVVELHVLSHYRRERDDSRRTISRQAPPPEEDFHRHHKSSYYRSENKSNDPTSEKALEGLDEIARSCFLTIIEAVQCPMSWLRAIYELNNQEQSRMLEEVQRRYDGAALRPSDNILAEARKWEPGYKEGIDHDLDQLKIDVGVVRFEPVEVDPTDWVVEPEDLRGPGQLLMSSASISEESQLKEIKAKAKAYEVVNSEVKRESKTGGLAYNLKLFDMIAILHARRLVAAMFVNWPSSERLSPAVLNNNDGIGTIGFLDLVERLDDKLLFNKVLSRFIQHGSADVIKSLSLAACQCMMRSKLVTIFRESEHHYKSNTNLEDKVRIPGSAGLAVQFDPRCQTEPVCDRLIFATSLDYTSNYRCFHGPGVNNWEDFEAPGDTLYYKFTSDATNNDWGWRFTVIGGRCKRYEIGHHVLSTLLTHDIEFARTLPLRQIWTLLVGVVCSQVADERLKAIGLLMKVLMVVTSPVPWQSKVAFEAKQPDLRLLRPLWYLYTDLLNMEAGGGTVSSLVSPVLRGLTELFMVVETVAQKWGVLDDLVSELATRASLKRCLTKGVMNVGILGSFVRMPNVATKALGKGVRKCQRRHTVGKGKPKHAASYQKRPGQKAKVASGSGEKSGCLPS